MKDIEKQLFQSLTSQSGFYIKDFNSQYLNENKFIAILDEKEYIYAVLVCNENERINMYNEAINFLRENYNKRILLNLFINCNGDYEAIKNENYSKIIYSYKESKVVYSDNSCKPLETILNYSNKVKESEKNKFRDNAVTYILMAINIVIFIITAVISQNLYNIDNYTLIVFGAKVNELINGGQPWRLLTSAFLHGGLMHIVFNMYALKVMGCEVEYVYGKARYLIVYLISAFGGNILSYIFNPNSISVGASGAIFGLLGAMLVFGIKHKNRIGKAYIMSLVKVVLINMIIGITVSNIDNAGHIGGLLFGAIAAFLVGDKKILSNKE